MTDEQEPTPISQAHMAAVDRLWLSPGERATRVYEALAPLELSEWDVICFCVEYLGFQSIAIDDEGLTSRVVAMAQWLYSVHYIHPARIYGPPDRKGASNVKLEVLHQEGQEVPPSDPSGGVPPGTEHHEGVSEAQGHGGEHRDSHVVGSIGDPDGGAGGTPQGAGSTGLGGGIEAPQASALGPPAGPAGNPHP